jgi:hypothetical protein
MVRTLERLAVFPLQLHRALGGLYHNGQKPELGAVPTLVTDVLKAIPPDGTNNWEHLDATKSAAEFVEWFRSAPMPKDREMETIAARITSILERENRESEEKQNG